MKKILNTFIEDAIKKLEIAKLNLVNSEKNTITFNNEYFDEKFMFDVNISNYFNEFKKLKAIKNPVLYWFEISSSENNYAIRNKFINYRDPLAKDFENPKYRYTSGYKTDYSKDSKTLYVGKVETGFWGRLVTHLGYSKFNTTAGMQLFHWYKPNLYGDITLNFIEFDSDMKHLIIILEKQLAKELKPLIGRY